VRDSLSFTVLGVAPLPQHRQGRILLSLFGLLVPHSTAFLKRFDVFKSSVISDNWLDFAGVFLELVVSS